MKILLTLIGCGCTVVNNAGDPAQAEKILSEWSEQAHEAKKDYPPIELVYCAAGQACREMAMRMYPQVPAVVVPKLLPFQSGKGPATKTEGLAAMSEEESLYQYQAQCIHAFLSMVDEMTSKGIEAAAIIVYSEFIRLVMQRYCMPRSRYRSWDSAQGGGFGIEFDSSLFTAKLLYEI